MVGQLAPPSLSPEADKKTKPPITTAHIPLFKMPKKHLASIVERIDPRLDSTMTGPLDLSSVAMVVWLLSRVKLNTLVQDFHV